MLIIRTIPAKIPDDRNYVVDSLDTVVVQNYDMHFLADLDDSVLLLEWDIAVAYHDLWNMRAHINAAPHLVHVAPYPLYPESLDEIVAPVWAHRDIINPMPLQMRWIDYGDSSCDIFSTGMVYLPRDIVSRIAESDDLVTWHHNITDAKLAFWYYYTIGERVPVHWDVRPIHLHYNQEVFYEHGSGTRLGSRELARSNRKSL